MTKGCCDCSKTQRRVGGRRPYVRPQLTRSSVAKAIATGTGSRKDRLGFNTKG
jgi:hypothetical protein